jgi:hypothetical protein
MNCNVCIVCKNGKLQQPKQKIKKKDPPSVTIICEYFATRKLLSQSYVQIDQKICLCI